MSRKHEALVYNYLRRKAGVSDAQFALLAVALCAAGRAVRSILQNEGVSGVAFDHLDETIRVFEELTGIDTGDFEWIDDDDDI